MEIDSDDDFKYLESIKESIEKEYLSYYYIQTEVSQKAYLHAKGDTADINDIKILKPDGQIVSLEDYSPIVKGLIDSAKKTSIRVFYKEPLCQIK